MCKETSKHTSKESLKYMIIVLFVITPLRKSTSLRVI